MYFMRRLRKVAIEAPVCSQERPPFRSLQSSDKSLREIGRKAERRLTWERVVLLQVQKKHHMDFGVKNVESANSTPTPSSEEQPSSQMSDRVPFCGILVRLLCFIRLISC